MRTRLVTLLAGVCCLLNAACMGPQPEYRTSVTVKDLMNFVVDPNADYLWGSVAVISTVKGFVEKAPRTREDWEEARRHAITLMEASNLLQIPGRPVARPGDKAKDPRVEEPPEVIQTLIDSDRANWTRNAQGLYDAGLLMLKAIDAQNAQALQDAGEDLDKACETCHVRYWYPHQFDNKDKSAPAGSVRKQ